MRRQMASLLLCTFLFAIPLTYLRASADNGIQVSIFATMLVLLGAIFGLDMWLRKKTGGEALPKLLVLLMSGGMLLLPFLLGRSFFFSAVLIMTGGYVFRAYIYPEFVNMAHPRGRHLSRRQVRAHVGGRPPEVRRRQRMGIAPLPGRVASQEAVMLTAS